MKAYQEKFLKIALSTEALEFGEFTLKSGRKSPYFFNAAKMLNGGSISELAWCYTEAIKEKDLDFDSIYGPAYKGIFIGSIVAMHFSQNGIEYPLSFNRKEVKDHGEGGNIIGPNPSGNILIIDDVLSAGTAAKESIEIIKENGAVPKFFVIGLDRQEKGSSNLSARNQLEATYGVSVISIINLDTLISFANNSNEYQQYLKDLQNYRELWGA